MSNSISTNLEPWERIDTPLNANKRRIFIVFHDVFIGDCTTYCTQKEIRKVVEETFEGRSEHLKGLNPKRVAEKLADILKDGWLKPNSDARKSLMRLLLNYDPAATKIDPDCAKANGSVEVGINNCGKIREREDELDNHVTTEDSTDKSEKEIICGDELPNVRNTTNRYERESHGQSNCSIEGNTHCEKPFISSIAQNRGQNNKRGRSPNWNDNRQERANKRNRKEGVGRPFVPDLPFCDLGAYQQTYDELMALPDINICDPLVQSRILNKANQVITRACYDWCCVHYPTMLREMKWDTYVNAQLHLFHRNLTRFKIPQDILNLPSNYTVGKFLALLRKISQIRHSAIHDDKKLPVRLIEIMVGDTVVLSTILRDSKKSRVLQGLKDEAALEDPASFLGYTAEAGDVRYSILRQIRETEQEAAQWQCDVARMEDEVEELHRRNRRFREQIDVLDSVLRRSQSYRQAADSL